MRELLVFPSLLVSWQGICFLYFNKVQNASLHNLPFSIAVAQVVWKALHTRDTTRKYLDALEKAGCREKDMTEEMQHIVVTWSAFVRRGQCVCASNTPFFPQGSSSSGSCHHVHCGDAGCWDEGEGLCCGAHVQGSPLVGISPGVW